jgi:hypothetical protein
MNPFTSERNLTPSSTASESLAFGVVGVVVSFHKLHGHVGGGTVEKDQVKLAAKALPTTSFTRGSAPPPLTVAVYAVSFASALVGVSVAVRVAPL